MLPAPTKLPGFVGVGCATETGAEVDLIGALVPVPNALLVVVLYIVDVAVATTSETVIVRVMVEVEVMVLSMEVCAIARKGSKRAAVIVGRCIVKVG